MTTTYNSNRKPLVFPEYGRHIQQMIYRIIEMKDDKERQAAAETIVGIMGRMNPNMKDVDDFNHKLWDHLFIISDYKINVQSPFGNPMPSDTIIEPKPIEYKDRDIRYKQYGRILFKMIKEVENCKTDEEKTALAMLVANHIKKSLYLWNNEATNDNLVIEIMKNLSKGKLNLPEGTQLVDFKQTGNTNNFQRKKGKKKKGK